MESVKRMQLILLTSVAFLTLGVSQNVSAQAAAQTAALSKNLQDVYLYWRNAMVNKNHGQWAQATASHQKISIQNRILSEKGQFPADIFKTPVPPAKLLSLIHI